MTRGQTRTSASKRESISRLSMIRRATGGSLGKQLSTYGTVSRNVNVNLLFFSSFVKNINSAKYLVVIGWKFPIFKNYSATKHKLFCLTVYGTLPHPATRPLKTHSMAVRAIPLHVCHHGPPNGYRTGFKKCSDAQLFIQLSIVDDINAKAVEAWKQNDPLSMTCIHWYYSYNTASISDMI